MIFLRGWDSNNFIMKEHSPVSELLLILSLLFLLRNSQKTVHDIENISHISVM